MWIKISKNEFAVTYWYCFDVNKYWQLDNEKYILEF